jgi:hypothetical protein
MRFTLLLVVLLSACGAVTEQSIYEGIRVRDRVNSVDGPDQKDQVLPSYDQYNKARELLKK